MKRRLCGLYIGVACAGFTATSACGLERDWAAWQALGASDTGSTGSSTGAGSTGVGSTDGPGSGSQHGSDADSTDATPPGTTTLGSTGPASDTSTASGTTGPTPVCGNGVVEGDEECDDPGQTACFECIRDRLVFVTSSVAFPGNFGDEAADLDFDCNQMAAFAGLLDGNKRRFKTWISTTTESAADRLYHSPGRYVLRNGLVFAESWDALIAGQILNPLNVDENSQTQNATVWTDTRPDGTPMPGDHCQDWKSQSWEAWAYWGDSWAMDGSWTLYVGDATQPDVCLGSAALYCFESP